MVRLRKVIGHQKLTPYRLKLVYLTRLSVDVSNFKAWHLQFLTEFARQLFSALSESPRRQLSQLLQGGVKCICDDQLIVLPLGIENARHHNSVSPAGPFCLLCALRNFLTQIRSRRWANGSRSERRQSYAKRQSCIWLCWSKHPSAFLATFRIGGFFMQLNTLLGRSNNRL
jgi:hypothetical protein